MDADEMAKRMPLTHFPAKVGLAPKDGGSSWTSWGELRPKGSSGSGDVFDDMRDGHVFLYAGPACFALFEGAKGDSVMYFSPKTDAHLDGHACPFDTGACRPLPKGCLQPYAGQGPAECQAVIEACSVPSSELRQRLGDWLAASYDGDSHGRYLETGVDPRIDGAPDRTQPPELLTENGATGAKKHGKCADRRAWTWEVRSTRPVPLSEVVAIHVRPESYKVALRSRRELAARGRAPRVIRAPKTPTSPRALYMDSQRVLRHLMRAE